MFMRRALSTNALVISLLVSACGDSGSSQSPSPNAARSQGAAATNSYTVGGSVSGLSGDGLILEVNGGADVAIGANGAFVFPQAIESGTAYTVSVKSQPSLRHESCVVSNASGTVTNGNVSTVSVDCTVVDGFVYVLNPGSQIGSYSLTPDTGLPVPLGSGTPLPWIPTDLVATPNGKSLYVVGMQNPSGGMNQLSTFAIDSATGALTRSGPTLQTGGQPGSLAVTPNGSLLLVANYGDSTIKSYTVDPNSGALTYASTLTIYKHIRHRIVVTPDSRFLYVLNGDIDTGHVVSLTAYAIDSTTGVLTAGPSFTPDDAAWAMAPDPLGHYLYLTVGSGTDFAYPTSVVRTYSIDSSSGALTAVGAGTGVAVNGFELAADPKGKYVYVMDNNNYNSTNDVVIALAVDRASGTLTQIAGPIRAGSDPWAIACDPSGRYLFSANVSPAPAGSMYNDLSEFTISQSGSTAGTLTPSAVGIQFNYATQGGVGQNAIAFVE